MKKFYALYVLICFSMNLSSQNVGIGTAIPINKNHISTPISSDGLLLQLLSNDNGDYTGLYFKTNDTDVDEMKKGAIFYEKSGSFGRGDIHFANDSDQNTGNVNISDSKMTIKNNGNVGIGTTNPSLGKLQINEGGLVIRASEFSSNSNSNGHDNLGSITFYGHNRPLGNSSARIRVGSTGWDDAGYLSFETIAGAQDATERMRITESGYVGIGTINPVNKMHISSNSGDGLLLEVLSASNNHYAGMYFKVTPEETDEMKKAAFFFVKNGSYGRGDLHAVVDNQADRSNVDLGDIHTSFLRNGRLRVSDLAGSENKNLAVNTSGEIIKGKTYVVSYHTVDYSGSSFGQNRTIWFPNNGDGGNNIETNNMDPPHINEYKCGWSAISSGRIVRVVVRVAANNGFQGRLVRCFDIGTRNIGSLYSPSSNGTAIMDNLNNDAEFNVGQRIAVGINTSCNGCYFSSGVYYVSILWEYDI